MLQADLDAWYEALKDVTYKSVFLALSPTEAEAMLKVYNARLKKEEANTEDIAILNNLEKRIASKMQELPSGAVFAKLSSRSPKDATNRIPVKFRLLEEYLKDKAEKSSGGKLTPNDIVSAIFQAHIGSFKVPLFFWRQCYQQRYHILVAHVRQGSAGDANVLGSCCHR